MLSPSGAGVTPKNLAGAFTLRCLPPHGAGILCGACSYSSQTPQISSSILTAGVQGFYYGSGEGLTSGCCHLAVLGSNLRTLLVLSPCGATSRCRNPVWRLLVVISHTPQGSSSMMPAGVQDFSYYVCGEGLTSRCYHLAALGSNLRTLLPEPRIGSRIQKIFSWERILKHRHSDSIRSQLHWHNASF